MRSRWYSLSLQNPILKEPNCTSLSSLVAVGGVAGGGLAGLGLIMQTITGRQPTLQQLYIYAGFSADHEPSASISAAQESLSSHSVTKLSLGLFTP
jgi:hypothetical protein